MAAAAVLRRFWRQIFVLLVPLLFLPLPLVIATKPACCAYVIALMGVFWLSEVVPMAVVSFLPAILFPMMGVQTSKDVCRNYFKDSVMLFVGSLIVAVAVEESNLHKRIALRVLMCVGSKPRWLMLGFMCISGFLSMWMSNTATTAMITPITEAVVLELYKRKRAATKMKSLDFVLEKPPDHLHQTTVVVVTSEDGRNINSISRNSFTPAGMSNNPLFVNVNHGYLNDDAGLEADGHSTTTITSNTTETRTATDGDSKTVTADRDQLTVADLNPEEMRIAKGMVLCVAYAANIGGTATLTGTLPNIVFKGLIDVLYGPETGVNFATFLLYSFPGTVITLLVAFVWLQWMFVAKCPCGPARRKELASAQPMEDDEDEQNAIRQTIRAKYDELGPMGFGEGSVMFLFITLVAAWIFRNPQFINGWEVFFPKGYVTDATPAMLICFLLFVWPSSVCGSKGTKNKHNTILSWGSMKRRFPWDVFLLLGGAIALADGTQASGLTLWLKEQMHHFSTLPPWAMVIIICLLIATITEFASNGAIATIFLPVLANLAVVSDVNPLYYMIPATIACSFAFMLPVATPPNAIAFGCGYIKVWDMIRAGAMLNLIAIIILIVNIHTVGVWVFDVMNKPGWVAYSETDSSHDVFNATTEAMFRST